MRLLRALFIVALAACSADAGNDMFPFDSLSDTDQPEVDDTDGDREYLGPDYWGIAGDLVVVDGRLDLGASSVTATFYDDRGAPWRNDALEGPACSLGIVESVDGPELDNEEASLTAWWHLALDVDAEGPCPWPIPTPEAAGDSEAPQVILGLGELDPRLATSMAAAELDPGLPLYGLYALHPAADGDRVLVFGVAGTQAQFDGTETTVDEPPPADGSYALRTLLLLPVPEASRN